MATETMKVFEGPNRESLFDALRLGPKENRPVMFKIGKTGKKTRDVKIDVMGLRTPERCGTGNRWIVRGIVHENIADGHEGEIEMEYSTHSRTGTMKFEAGVGFSYW